MAEQAHEQMTEYQKFRLQKLANRNDDDNFSAHFSNISANISLYARSERDIKINSFRTSNENQEDFKGHGLDPKNFHLQSITKKYLELEQKYSELMRQFQEKDQEAEKYKKLYQEELNRERQTKQKLKNWVKEAKTNLHH